MVNGKLVTCVREHDVMYKLSLDDYSQAIASGVASPMIHNNRVMKQWVFISLEQLISSFDNWLAKALAF